MTTTPPRLTPEVARAAQREEEYGHYSMRFEWDPEDRIYVVSVPELPGCRTHGATYEEAATKGRDAVASWVDAARHWGTPIPPPRHWAP
jgi:predicted RNase H-like HicB family nuclease